MRGSCFSKKYRGIWLFNVGISYTWNIVFCHLSVDFLLWKLSSYLAFCATIFVPTLMYWELKYLLVWCWISTDYHWNTSLLAKSSFEKPTHNFMCWSFLLKICCVCLLYNNKSWVAFLAYLFLSVTICSICIRNYKIHYFHYDISNCYLLRNRNMYIRCLCSNFFSCYLIYWPCWCEWRLFIIDMSLQNPYGTTSFKQF